MKTTAEMNSVRGKYYSCDDSIFWMMVLISAISFFYFLSEVIAANVHWSQVRMYDDCHQKKYKGLLNEHMELWPETSHLKTKSGVGGPHKETVVDIPKRSFSPKSSGRNV